MFIIVGVNKLININVMGVNHKKAITLKNRTKYFDKTKDKVRVTFMSPTSYSSRQIKIEGYESRLYWQYRYCDEHNGQTFFYTLTYNDNALPVHYGINCFDYEDLRDLLTGGFRKQLLRKYGTIFKYFIGAELGDGKGERGLHNNPHYHILFFLEDAKNARFPYKKISSEDFRHLVRIYWQGFDEQEYINAKKPVPSYKTAKYGIAKEGENLGLVTDFRACMYCAKYVTKDAKLKMHEYKVIHQMKFLFKQFNLWKFDTFKKFLYDVLYPKYNIPLNGSNTLWQFNEDELLNNICPKKAKFDPEGFKKIVEQISIGKEKGYKFHRSVFGGIDYSTYDIRNIDFISELFGIHRDIYAGFNNASVHNFDKVTNNYELYSDYVSKLADEYSKEHLKLWRNRFCNKCRISQGLGDYALEHIADKMNPSVPVPCKDGFKKRPICMYYYRKLYTDVVTPMKGSIKGDAIVYPCIRVLNDLGIQYKVHCLSDRLKKTYNEAFSNLNMLLSSEAVYNAMVSSDVNTEVTMTYQEFIHYFNNLNKILPKYEIVKRYAEYKLVYEYRFFKAPYHTDNKLCDFPDINVSSDYVRFIKPSVFSVSRSDIRLDDFLEGSDKDYLPYSQHRYFNQIYCLCNVLTLLSDYLFVKEDDKAQRVAEEKAKVKRFHNEQKLKEFYSTFINF